jgi:hypothetical protein
MGNMDSESESVNSPLDEVYAFADRMGAHGVYNPTSARLKSAALKRISSVIADDESPDPRWVLDNVDALVNRLARLGNEHPDTMRTYRSRASSLLGDYHEYKAAPLEFTKRASEERPPRREAAAKPKKDASAQLEAPKVAPSPPLRCYPLGDGRDVEFRIPEGGMTLEQCLRFSLHLITLSTDFDPSRPEQVQAFGLLRTQ